MADETTPDELPFPEPLDDNDAPGFMQALAERIQVVLVALRAAFVPNTREIVTGAGSGLTGGGALDEDLELAVDFADSGVSSSTKAVKANDSRLDDDRDPTAHSHGVPAAIATLASDYVIDDDNWPGSGVFDPDFDVLEKTFTVPAGSNEYVVSIDLDTQLGADTAAHQGTCIVGLALDDVQRSGTHRHTIPVAGVVRLGVSREWIVTNLPAGDHTVSVLLALSIPGGGANIGQNLRLFATNSHLHVKRTT